MPEVHDGLTGSHDGAPASTRGTVTQVRPSGVLILVRAQLETDPGQDPITGAVEVTGSPVLRPGDTAEVALGGVAGWVVPI